MFVARYKKRYYLNISFGHQKKKKNAKHTNLREKILSITEVNKSNKIRNKSYPLIIGAPGGVVSECLQTIGKVYHITDNDFDVFSDQMWRNIKTKKISSNLYEYTVLNKQNLIETNSKRNNFIKLLRSN